jgi:hypothetical protein
MNWLMFKRQFAMVKAWENLVKDTSWATLNLFDAPKVLQIAALPPVKLIRVLRFTTLLLLLQDKAALISGKKIGQLILLYGENNYHLALGQSYSATVPSWNLELAQDPDFICASCLCLLEIIYQAYPEIVLILKARLGLKLKVNLVIANYWQQIKVLKSALGAAAAVCCPQTIAALEVAGNQ